MPIKAIKDNKFFPCLQHKFKIGNVWKSAILKDFYSKSEVFPFCFFKIWGNPMNVLEKRSYQLPTPHVHDTLIFKVLFAMLYSFQWTGNISWVIFKRSWYASAYSFGFSVPLPLLLCRPFSSNSSFDAFVNVYCHLVDPVSGSKCQ